MATPSETGPRRVRAVKRAYAAAGSADGETLAVTTPSGAEVHIDALATFEDGARSRVEVRLAGAVGGDPNFVVVNPPTLVPDPLGDIPINGVMYREDPLRALAQAIADNGGAAPIRKGRRGR